MTRLSTEVAKSATKAAPLRPKVLPRLSEADIKNMRIFKSVVDSGGLTAAEDRLGMEKSNISRAIRQLEDRLGEVLCVRWPKGFELTEFGRSVHSAAIMLGDALEVARSEMMRARNTMTGIVRMGMPDNCLSNSESFANDVLGQYMALMPEVELHLQVMSSEMLREALLERRIHLAISSFRLMPQRFENEILFNEHFRLYMKIEDGAPTPHLAQLHSRGISLVLREDEFLSKDWSKSVAYMQNRKVYASGLEAVAILIDSGLFAGFLPTHYIQYLERSKNFKEVIGASELRYDFPFYLTYERDRPRAYAVASMISQFLHHPQRVKP